MTSIAYSVEGLEKFDAADTAQQLNCGMGSGVHLGTRRIFLVGDVDEKMAGRFAVVFRALDSSAGPVHITLNSRGGSIDDGFAIYDTIRLSNNPVIIDVVGVAHSIAMLILQGGDLRRASPESRMMIHEGKMFSLGDGMSAEALSDLGQELGRDNQRYFEILAKRSKLSVSEVEKACEKDTYYGARDALAKGFIDEIVEPHKDVKVVVESKKPAPRKGKKKK